MAAIESVAERNLRGLEVLPKALGSAAAIGAAWAAPAIGLSGSMLAVGAILAVLVAYGVILQDRLRVGGVTPEPSSSRRG
ncbi:MAG: hypothetical protein R2991_01790 [Thermoanaerobaculia bacterium]